MTSEFKVLTKLKQARFLKVLTTIHGGNKLDNGFSLLEVLIALAIMSLSSLALFQSMSQMTKISSQAIQVSESVLESFLEDSVFTTVISGITAPWPEINTQAFSGNPEKFSGVSAGSPKSGYAKMKSFSIFIKTVQTDSSSLVYDDGASQWELGLYKTSDLKFEYLTDNNIWSPVWPPGENEINNDDTEKFGNPNVLPKSIKLRDKDQTLWIKSISKHQNLPYRIKEDG